RDDEGHSRSRETDSGPAANPCLADHSVSLITRPLPGGGGGGGLLDGGGGALLWLLPSRLTVLLPNGFAEVAGRELGSWLATAVDGDAFALPVVLALACGSAVLSAVALVIAVSAVFASVFCDASGADEAAACLLPTG